MRRLIRIIRNVALLLIAAILVLAGVLAFNVLTRTSRQLQVAAVPRVAVDQRGAAQNLLTFGLRDASGDRDEDPPVVTRCGIAQLSQAAAEHLNWPLEEVRVAIYEVGEYEWGIGGRSMAARRKDVESH